MTTEKCKEALNLIDEMKMLWLNDGLSVQQIAPFKKLQGVIEEELSHINLYDLMIEEELRNLWGEK